MIIPRTDLVIIKAFAEAEGAIREEVDREERRDEIARLFARAILRVLLQRAQVRHTRGLSRPRDSRRKSRFGVDVGAHESVHVWGAGQPPAGEERDDRTTEVATK